MATKTKKYPQNDIIKELRENRGLSQRELSSKLGLSRTSVWELENGYVRLNQETLQLYSDFFHVSFDYLLGKQRENLVLKGFTESQITDLLSNEKVIKDLQVKAIVILTMITKQDDLEQIILLMAHLLKESGINANEELKEKYQKYLK